MQALGLVRISKKQNLIEISLKKMSEYKQMGLGQKSEQKTATDLRQRGHPRPP